ncbi:MAG: DNA recombination protein RmuC [Bacteroides sp.]|nr:DNA recombination protein RmuC [Bacteroides sp.]
MDILEIVITVLCAALIVIGIIIVRRVSAKGDEASDKRLREIEKSIEGINAKLDFIGSENREQQSKLRSEVADNITRLGGSLRDEQQKQRQSLSEQLNAIRSDTLDMLTKIRTDNAGSMEKLRSENRESLDRINNTVNEKLQKTLDDKISKSFEAVNQRLTEVYRGLGEMKQVASGVSDLKKVLSNVKTRGTMGEIQLGAILSEILAPEQFAEQISVKPNGSERVDFAVRLPGKNSDDTVLLPIDSKFPGDCYQNLLDAYENGDQFDIKQKRAALTAEIRECAKSISTKYIAPPYTTNFAIMFLPFEGLYAEVINLGLVEELQNKFKINITGPSTMAAMLNSLQMGFKTLAIEKKSGEVWKVLEKAKKEFSNFEAVLEKVRTRLRTADDELDKLIGTRTKAINRELRTVTLSDEDGGEAASESLSDSE